MSGLVDAPPPRGALSRPRVPVSRLSSSTRGCWRDGRGWRGVLPPATPAPRAALAQGSGLDGQQRRHVHQPRGQPTLGAGARPPREGVESWNQLLAPQAAGCLYSYSTGPGGQHLSQARLHLPQTPSRPPAAVDPSAVRGTDPHEASLSPPTNFLFPSLRLLEINTQGLRIMKWQISPITLV